MFCGVQAPRLYFISVGRLGSQRVVARTAIHLGLTFDTFPLIQNPLAVSEADVSGREVAEVFVSPEVVMFDEDCAPHFELAGQGGAFEQDAVLERLVPALDLALRVRMAWRTAGVGHAPSVEPVDQVRR